MSLTVFRCAAVLTKIPVVEFTTDCSTPQVPLNGTTSMTTVQHNRFSNAWQNRAAISKLACQHPPWPADFSLRSGSHLLLRILWHVQRRVLCSSNNYRRFKLAAPCSDREKQLQGIQTQMTQQVYRGLCDIKQAELALRRSAAGEERHPRAWRKGKHGQSHS